MTLWSVQVLPSGTVTIGHRTPDFTREYREAIAEAFSARAVDYVPFMIGNSYTYTSDPANCHGEVRSLEIVDDGMDAVIEVDREADAAIRVSLTPGGPPFGAAPCLIENYLHPGGLPFPVVLLRVLGTTQPMITGLRGWQEVEAAR
jgi:hypothetical protein